MAPHLEGMIVHIFLCAWHPFFFLEGTSSFFANWYTHAAGELLVVLSLWLSLVVPSRFSFEARLVFPGRPPLGYNFLL